MADAGDDHDLLGLDGKEHAIVACTKPEVQWTDVTGSRARMVKNGFENSHRRRAIQITDVCGRFRIPKDAVRERYLFTDWEVVQSEAKVGQYIFHRNSLAAAGEVVSGCK